MKLFDSEARYRLPYLLIGGSLAAVPVLATLDNVPGPLSPHPLPLILASWGLGIYGLAVCLLFPAAFWALAPGLARGNGTIHSRSILFLAILIVTSLGLTALGYQGGVEYQGLAHSVTVSVVNTALSVALSATLVILRRRSSWLGSLVWHWVLLGWAGSYAFAYLGEAP